MNKRHIGLALLPALALISVGSVCAAQDAAPGGGRRGGQGPGGQRGFGAVQLADIPADFLATEMKLSADQKTKIKAIQDRMAAERKALLPKPGEQPDPNTFRETFQKMREMSERANSEVEGILTPEQQKNAPDLVRELGGIQMIGVPVGVLGDLKLTADQRLKLKSVSDEMQAGMRDIPQDQRREKMQELRQATQAKVQTVLTDAQKKRIEKWRQDNPGGFGFGGRRPGGPGGPPSV